MWELFESKWILAVKIPTKWEKKLKKKKDQEREQQLKKQAAKASASQQQASSSPAPSVESKEGSEELFTPSGSLSPKHQSRVEVLTSTITERIQELKDQIVVEEQRIETLKGGAKEDSSSDSSDSEEEEEKGEGEKEEFEDSELEDTPASKPGPSRANMASFIDVVKEAARNIDGDAVPGAQMKATTKLNTVIAFDFANLLTASSALVKEAQELFEYKGMDIWIILQKYLQKAKDDQDAEKNLVFMIVALCERGTNFSKFKNKMSSAGRQTIEQIAAKYGLATKLSPDVSNELTLARIGHAFPMLVCCYMQQCKSPTVPQSKMEKWAKKYPLCMKASAFTALIPSEPVKAFTLEHRDTLIKCYLCHQVEFSKVVTKKKDHKGSIKEWVDDTIGYAMAGVEAVYIPNTTRLECLQELGIWSTQTSGFGVIAIQNAADELEKQAGEVVIP